MVPEMGTGENCLGVSMMNVDYRARLCVMDMSLFRLQAMYMPPCIS